MTAPTIIYRDGPVYISRNTAYCIVLLLPARLVRNKRTGLIAQEIPEHWEQMTMQGRVVRFHTLLEAQEAFELNVVEGMQRGYWLAADIQPYDPKPSDIPYHEWVRGIEQSHAEELGLDPDDLPENQDPSLRKISDEEWLLRGPR